MNRLLAVVLLSAIAVQAQDIIIVRKSKRPAAREFVTSYTPPAGPTRSDFYGCVGGKITIGPNPIVATHLGRWVLPGNSGTRVVYLTDSGGGIIQSATVDLTSVLPGRFAYAAIPDTVLVAGGIYRIMSFEDVGGPSWYNVFGTFTTTNVATINVGSYAVAPCGNSAGDFGDGSMYVPVSFRYR